MKQVPLFVLLVSIILRWRRIPISLTVATAHRNELFYEKVKHDLERAVRSLRLQSA